MPFYWSFNGPQGEQILLTYDTSGHADLSTLDQASPLHLPRTTTVLGRFLRDLRYRLKGPHVHRIHLSPELIAKLRTVAGIADRDSHEYRELARAVDAELTAIVENEVLPRLGFPRTRES